MHFIFGWKNCIVHVTKHVVDTNSNKFYPNQTFRFGLLSPPEFSNKDKKVKVDVVKMYTQIKFPLVTPAKIKYFSKWLK